MKPRVVVLSLTSDFGCQVQLSNYPELVEMISTIDILYWQLVTSGSMPTDYDVAVIEGAVTTTEEEELLKEVRETASCIITMGACAVTGGIPALALNDSTETHLNRVYGSQADLVAKGHITPRPVSSVVDVDFEICGCPINPAEFSRVLQRAVRGLTDRPQVMSMCGECKTAENECMWASEKPCIGLLARSGCGATCISRGRACTACRGIAKDANIQTAYAFAKERGFESSLIDDLLDIYNCARKGA